MVDAMEIGKKFTLEIVILIIILCGNNNAQEKIIKVWPDKIPGAIENLSYKVETDSNESWSWMKNVSDPTLDYYPAKKEKSNGTAVIVCPGGGYSVLAIGHEGSQIARWFNSIGISAFVLKYRLPNDLIMTDKTIGPLQDGQEAIRIVRRYAKEWNINPNKIGIIGFSAGGHFASSVSTHFNEKVYEYSDSTSARPDFSILIYPVISMDSSITHMGSRENLLGKNPSPELVKKFSNELQVTKNTPPAFLVHALDDNAVPVENSINYVLALRKNSVAGELHIYEKGGHGFGLGRQNGTESSWPEACVKWLKANGFIQ
jgi:acetyl esterase/lipase